MKFRPLLIIFLLCFVYWRVPLLVPHTKRLARWTLAAVLLMMLPHAIYSTLCGYPSWSSDLPKWVWGISLMAGVGTFVLFALGAAVCFIDARRTP